MDAQLKGETPKSGERRVSVADGAVMLGVDSFTLLGFIQRDRLTATRSPSGEIMIPESELARLTNSERSAPC